MNKLTLKTNSGFLLVEAIISITILVMVAATSISLLVMGHRAVNVNEHSLEASWIAQEAAESLRGLRDTNWIRYGFDKETCWDSAQDICEPGVLEAHFVRSLVGEEYQFFLSTSLTGAPTINKAGRHTNLDLDAGAESTINKRFLLYYQDLDDTTDYDGDGITDNDKQYIGPEIAGYTTVEPTKYYRAVETSLVDDGKGGTYIEATVTVGWYEGSKPHEINLPVTLTNYQLEE